MRCARGCVEVCLRTLSGIVRWHRVKVDRDGQAVPGRRRLEFRARRVVQLLEVLVAHGLLDLGKARGHE